MIHNLVEKIEESCRLPDINGELCVHSVIENGSCRRCVTVCPLDAWIIDDEQVGILPDLCDGCGLCAAACPEGAIEHDFHPELGHWGDRVLAMVACERSSAHHHSGKIVIPCNHAMGIRHLLLLYRQGCRYLLTLSGNCLSCDRGKGVSISDNVENINKMLSSKGLTKLSFKSLDTGQWHRIYDKINHEAPQENLDRRNFFKNAATEIVRRGLQQAGIEKSSGEAILPGSILPITAEENTVFPFVPVLDMTRCTGCNGCIRSCPHQAISFQDIEESGASYIVRPELCSGCDICTDVCVQHAIKVQYWSTNTMPKIPLIKSYCRSCGIALHKPDAAGQDHSICHICSTSNHHNNLFQVIE